MRKVILLHGTGGNPDSYWFPYIKKSLSQERYEVTAPQLPDTDSPNLEKQLPFILEKYDFDQDTILVAHSAGCPLILSILENIDQPISKAILVGGFSTQLSHGKSQILQEEYDWEKIKANAKNFVFINSVNDPWGCDDKQGKNMFDHLGGTMITFEKEGHMGSDKFDQPYKEFPLVRTLIES